MDLPEERDDQEDNPSAMPESDGYSCLVCCRPSNSECMPFCQDCEEWDGASSSGVDGRLESSTDGGCVEVPTDVVSVPYTPIVTAAVNLPAMTSTETSAMPTTTGDRDCPEMTTDTEVAWWTGWMQSQAELLRKQMEEQLQQKLEKKRAELHEIVERATRDIMRGEVSNSIGEEAEAAYIGKVDEWKQKIASEMRDVSIAQPSALEEMATSFRPESSFTATTMTAGAAYLSMLDNKSPQMLYGVLHESGLLPPANSSTPAAIPQSQYVPSDLNVWGDPRYCGVDDSSSRTLSLSGKSPTQTVPSRAATAALILEHEVNLAEINAVGEDRSLATDWFPSPSPWPGPPPVEEGFDVPPLVALNGARTDQPRSTSTVSDVGVATSFLELQDGLRVVSVESPDARTRVQRIKGESIPELPRFGSGLEGRLDGWKSSATSHLTITVQPEPALTTSGIGVASSTLVSFSVLRDGLRSVAIESPVTRVEHVDREKILEELPKCSGGLKNPLLVTGRSGFTTTATYDEVKQKQKVVETECGENVLETYSADESCQRESTRLPDELCGVPAESSVARTRVQHINREMIPKELPAFSNGMESRLVGRKSSVTRAAINDQLNHEVKVIESGRGENANESCKTEQPSKDEPTPDVRRSMYSSIKPKVVDGVALTKWETEQIWKSVEGELCHRMCQGQCGEHRCTSHSMCEFDERRLQQRQLLHSQAQSHGTSKKDRLKMTRNAKVSGEEVKVPHTNNQFPVLNEEVVVLVRKTAASKMQIVKRVEDDFESDRLNAHGHHGTTIICSSFVETMEHKEQVEEAHAGPNQNSGVQRRINAIVCNDNIHGSKENLEAVSPDEIWNLPAPAKENPKSARDRFKRASLQVTRWQELMDNVTQERRTRAGFEIRGSNLGSTGLLRRAEVVNIGRKSVVKRMPCWIWSLGQEELAMFYPLRRSHARLALRYVARFKASFLVVWYMNTSWNGDEVWAIRDRWRRWIMFQKAGRIRLLVMFSKTLPATTFEALESSILTVAIAKALACAVLSEAVLNSEMCHQPEMSCTRLMLIKLPRLARWDPGGALLIVGLAWTIGVYCRWIAWTAAAIEIYFRLVAWTVAAIEVCGWLVTFTAREHGRLVAEYRRLELRRGKLYWPGLERSRRTSTTLLGMYEEELQIRQHAESYHRRVREKMKRGRLMKQYSRKITLAEVTGSAKIRRACVPITAGGVHRKLALKLVLPVVVVGGNADNGTGSSALRAGECWKFWHHYSNILADSCATKRPIREVPQEGSGVMKCQRVIERRSHVNKVAQLQMVLLQRE